MAIRAILQPVSVHSLLSCVSQLEGGFPLFTAGLAIFNMYLIFSLYCYFNGCRFLWVSPCWTSGFCYFFFFKECYELNASVPQDFYIEILSSNLIIRGWGLWDVIRSWKLSLYDWALMVMISRDLGCSLRWPWTQSPPISACWFLVLQCGPPHQKIHRFFLFCSGRD